MQGAENESSKPDEMGIDELQDACKYARRWYKGKKGQPFIATRQVDITRNIQRRTAVLLERLAKGLMHNTANGPVSWLEQYLDTTLWKIYEYLFRFITRRFMLSLTESAAKVTNIRKARKWLRAELQRRGYKLAIHKRYNKASQPKIIIHFYHKAFGRWRTKLMRILDDSRHILRHQVQDTLGSPQIWFSHDLPISRGILNHGPVCSKIDMTAYKEAKTQCEAAGLTNDEDNNTYLRQLKAQHCKCDECNEKYYGNGIRHVATPDLNVLGEHTKELQKLLAKGTKYRPDITNPQIPEILYIKAMFTEEVSRALAETYKDDVLGYHENYDSSDNKAIADWLVTIEKKLHQSIDEEYKAWEGEALKVDNVLEPKVIEAMNKEIVQQCEHRLIMRQGVGVGLACSVVDKEIIEAAKKRWCFVTTDKLTQTTTVCCKYLAMLETIKEHENSDFYKITDETKSDIIKKQGELLTKHGLMPTTWKDEKEVDDASNQLPHIALANA